MKLKELGEFGLIDRIAGKVKPHSGVKLGIGDDAAAIAPTPGTLTLATSDMLVEGVHFDLSLSDFLTLGRKSLAVNLSDLAAMGAVPRSFLLSIALPSSITVDAIDFFCTGLMERADQFDVALVGGDTCASRSGLIISVTLLGEQRGDLVVTRSGARPGDLICITGTVGDSALGLELLRQGVREGGAVERHLDPLPRVREGLRLAESRLASAMIDVSDGVLADLGHILELSRVGAVVETASLPLSEELVEQCRKLGLDPLQLALSGGEDYELLFTIAPDARGAVIDLFAETGLQLSVIGTVTDSGTLFVRAPDGTEYRTVRHGYNHFA